MEYHKIMRNHLGGIPRGFQHRKTFKSGENGQFHNIHTRRFAETQNDYTEYLKENGR